VRRLYHCTGYDLKKTSILNVVVRISVVDMWFTAAQSERPDVRRAVQSGAGAMPALHRCHHLLRAALPHVRERSTIYYVVLLVHYHRLVRDLFSHVAVVLYGASIENVQQCVRIPFPLPRPLSSVSFFFSLPLMCRTDFLYDIPSPLLSRDHESRPLRRLQQQYASMLLTRTTHSAFPLRATAEALNTESRKMFALISKIIQNTATGGKFPHKDPSAGLVVLSCIKESRACEHC
jgi:hypothetical protein